MVRTSSISDGLTIMASGIILFDGECGVCSRLVTFVVTRDPAGAFRFASLQSEAGQAVLLAAGLSRSDFDTLVLVDAGRVFTKSTAALRIAAKLSGGWPLMRMLAVVPGPLRDRVYDLVARNRFRLFSTRARCLMPHAVADRMIDVATAREIVLAREQG